MVLIGDMFKQPHLPKEIVVLQGIIIFLDILPTFYQFTEQLSYFFFIFMVLTCCQSREDFKNARISTDFVPFRITSVLPHCVVKTPLLILIHFIQIAKRAMKSGIRITFNWSSSFFFWNYSALVYSTCNMIVAADNIM